MKYLCGIDEAGRGPLAGPVTASAVILPDDFPFEILSDSKKISEKKRTQAAKIIKDLATSWSVAWVSPATIDRINIHNASLLAMQRAYNNIPESIRINCEVIVDGKFIPDIPSPAASIVKGDSLIYEIMAASIVAKTERDSWMIKMAERYPKWGFERHKGYPTKEHRRLCMEEKSLTPIHRKSFTFSSSL